MTRLFNLISLLVLGAGTHLYGQTSYYYAHSNETTTDGYNTWYEVPIFSAPANQSDACSTAFRQYLVQRYGQANAGYGTCLEYKDRVTAQQEYDLGASSNIRKYIVLSWSYPLGEVPHEFAYIEHHAIGRGATEAAATAVARKWATTSYGTDIDRFGETKCSSLAGRDPAWFCTTSFWTNAKGNTIQKKITGNIVNGTGRTEAEALADAQTKAENAWTQNLLLWTVRSCSSDMSHSPPWSCMLDITNDTFN